ncbi:MAG: carboxypeptidase regulatory-like domain-containing protein [Deltaproteobacteria bacterium]|nr:carboxypeptidase regulatory-like domain-containing protein [Deltaproteobacteria bacterium]
MSRERPLNSKRLGNKRASPLVSQAIALKNDDDTGRLPRYFAGAGWLMAPLCIAGVGLAMAGVFSVQPGFITGDRCEDCAHKNHDDVQGEDARLSKLQKELSALQFSQEVQKELLVPANESETTTVSSASCQVSVRVTEPAFSRSSLAADDAKLVLHRVDEKGPLDTWNAVTHHGGLHRFTDLPRGIYHLTVRSDEAAPKAAPVFVCTENNDRLFFELDLVRPDAELDVQIFGKGKKPVPGTWAMIQQPPGHRNQMWGVLHVPVDEDGHLKVALPAGRYRVVTRAPHHNGQFLDVNLEKTSGTLHSRVKLTWRPEITGVVRNEAGQPVVGAEVFLGPILDPRVTLARTITDTNGEYVLPFTPGTAPVVSAWNAGRTATTATSADEQTLAGYQAVEVKLQAGRTVSGDVMEITGKDRPFAKVRFRVRRTGHTGVIVADKNGHFELSGMPNDDVDLWPEDGANGAWSGMAATLERTKVLLTFVPKSY